MNNQAPKKYLYFMQDHALKNLLAEFGLIAALDSDSYEQVWSTLQQYPLQWEDSSDLNYPYSIEMGETTWRLRLNNTLEGEPKYTLLVDQEAMISFDLPPEAWFLP